MSDKCPFCGAEIDKDALGWVRFSCNTIRYKPVAGFPGSYSSGITCHKRQIANLQASRDRWKELFEAYSEYGMGTYFTTDGEAAVKQAIAALKEAGEWEEI